MNFESLYNKLISFRQIQILEKSKDQFGKIESHHILPRCCGGTDDPKNIVNLYAKEHFMAHYFLWKMHENDEFKYQLLQAFWMMCTMSSSNQDRTYQEFIKMSEEYQQARIEFAKHCSETIAEKIKGEKNGAYGKHWYHDPLTNKIGMFVEGQQPSNWVLGKTQKQEKTLKIKIPIVNQCKNCGKICNNAYCSDACKKEMKEKLLNARRQLEAEQIEKMQKFSAQTTSLYNGVVNRNQVRRYFEFKGKHSCKLCGKTDTKLIVHAIDGNCKNLDICNYEFLCQECYLKSGTAGFTGRSMHEIIEKKKNASVDQLAESASSKVAQ